jgi:uncharacterized protein YndB with AHSA1/START domain
MSAQLEAKPSLVIRRRLAAAPEKVFAAWTNPEKIMRWWGTKDATTLRAQTDLRPGGRFAIGFRTPDGEEHDVGGVYREVIANQKLVFTWAWRTTPQRESLVTISLKPDGDGTWLTLRHEQFFDETARDNHQSGWAASLDRLERFAILDFYLEPLGGGTAFDALPGDVASLARVVPGLLLHQHIAPVYGETLSQTRIAEAHLRGVDDILGAVLKHDGAPLGEARPPAQRAIGVCRHFTLLLVAMLRHKGTPARARCGFGAYFETGKFVDHWAAEVWDGARWVLVDPQMDAVQRKLFHIDFDPLDVPRDRFLVAGDAWRLCRAGKADADAFGILDMQGWWFIAGNVVRDIAALNDATMLPWDVWGAMPQPGEAPDFARFDALAELTLDPDAHFAQLRAQPPVPPTVFNAVLQRVEKV